jgi:GPI mannosyltransferase 4
VPLFFVSITPFTARRKRTKLWIAVWLVFNLALGTLFGVYHQGGVVPAQLHLSKLQLHKDQQVTAVWWKTYQPPTWLLGNKAGRSIKTVDLMGASRDSLVETLSGTAGRCGVNETYVDSYLVAPRSTVFLDQFVGKGEKVEKKKKKGKKDSNAFELREEWTYRKHLNLDDLDFGDDGVLPTIDRVWGRRGIVVWKVCKL